MEKNAIQRVDPPQSPIMQLAAMANQSDGKIDAAGLKELLAVQMTWEANEARKAYVAAMAAFKADPPQIVKDQKVSYGQTKYNHASLANVTACVNSALSEHGLSAAWETGQEDGKVKVACKITHVFGHSESTYITAPPDSSGKKNPIQEIGSTITYLQRYTLLALTGLATYEDDDGNRAGEKPKPEIPTPGVQEQVVIDAIALKVPAPDGMRVDPTKLYPIFWGEYQRYPADITKADALADWIAKRDLQQIFIPDKRSDFEKAEGMPGDEDSVPDTPEEATAAAKFGKENDVVPCRFLCNACSHEYDGYIKIDQCPKCLNKDVIDREAK